MSEKPLPPRGRISDGRFTSWDEIREDWEKPKKFTLSHYVNYVLGESVPHPPVPDLRDTPKVLAYIRKEYGNEKPSERRLTDILHHMGYRNVVVQQVGPLNYRIHAEVLPDMEELKVYTSFYI